jgi:hypothetical protein
MLTNRRTDSDHSLHLPLSRVCRPKGTLDTSPGCEPSGEQPWVRPPRTQPQRGCTIPLGELPLNRASVVIRRLCPWSLLDQTASALPGRSNPSVGLSCLHCRHQQKPWLHPNHRGRGGGPRSCAGEPGPHHLPSGLDEGDQAVVEHMDEGPKSAILLARRVWRVLGWTRRD